MYGSAITFYETLSEAEEDLLSQDQRDGLRLAKYRRREDRKVPISDQSS